ncbi:FERM domain-containing protein 6-like isoform X2 [Mugil cephalus]|uniref:FERM domain-containing protein 6-like isoform X2 n=1 Tax=Mugil cephalus TaxID=48193 RepID=UPI001FB5A6B6|nr:FERM domain-containing protein 6-like isoform X2 [Mugil cephalus]
MKDGDEVKALVTMMRKRRRHVCILLPSKQHMDCTVTVSSRGREVLNVVLKQLGVSDLQVFGLAVVRDNEYLFLDLEQKLSNYFGRRWNMGSLAVPFILFLRVQYYVESGLLILSSKVQQLYYTELRQTVLRSQSRHQEALFFQLAASALQAEIGDREQREWSEGEKKHKYRNYFLPEDYFPSWLIKHRGRDFLLQHGPVLHDELSGLTRSQAMLQFIKEASGLQDGAVTFYRMKEEKKKLRSLILLGVAVKGVHIYREVGGKLCLLYDFSWTDVDRFTVQVCSLQTCTAHVQIFTCRSATLQGCRFEIAAVASLCLPKLVYYTPSAFHSKHILRHLSDSHRFHMNTRDALSCIRQLEDVQDRHHYKEAYVCDTAQLSQRLSCSNLTSSTSDCSAAARAATAQPGEEEEEEDGVAPSADMLLLDESEEDFVDDPAEVPWLAELLQSTSVVRPLILSSPRWAAVTMEMKQVLWRRAEEGEPVD